ncbi:MAG: heavy metal translocating P-type ATPase, partial [Desulfovibrionaceae bacterium]|nr:heavy metal translocating P-type ATPase [Desulfovibrionaceae bacterium]
MFYIVHELRGLNTSSSGRIRLRARDTQDAARLAETLRILQEQPGISQVSVNPRVGSVLFFYNDTQARTAALRLLTGDKAEALPAPAESGAPAIPQEQGPDGLYPLLRFIFVRPFLPAVWRMVSSVFSALPFLVKGLKALLSGRLNVDVLDAAAIAASLLMRDFRTVRVLTLLLGLGEALEYWTRRRSLDSLTESLSLNVDTVWLLTEDGNEISVPLAQVRADDLVVVRDGGSIPVDGVVEDGYALVNQASMTGESMPVRKTE